MINLRKYFVMTALILTTNSYALAHKSEIKCFYNTSQNSTQAEILFQAAANVDLSNPNTDTIELRVNKAKHTTTFNVANNSHDTISEFVYKYQNPFMVSDINLVVATDLNNNESIVSGTWTTDDSSVRKLSCQWINQ